MDGFVGDGKGFFPPVKSFQYIYIYISKCCDSFIEARLYQYAQGETMNQISILLIRSARSRSLASSIVALLLSADSLIALLSLCVVGRRLPANRQKLGKEKLDELIVCCKQIKDVEAYCANTIISDKEGKLSQ